jgi:hypothetical protein
MNTLHTAILLFLVFNHAHFLSTGRAVVARNQTYRDAFSLQIQLQQLGFTVEVLALLPPTGLFHLIDKSRAGEGVLSNLCTSSIDIDLRCPNGHLFLVSRSGSTSSAIRCDSCSCSKLNEVCNYVLSCRGCNVDLCELCVCTGRWTTDSAVSDAIDAANSTGSASALSDDASANLSDMERAVRAGKKQLLAEGKDAIVMAAHSSAAALHKDILFPVLFGKEDKTDYLFR